MSAKANPSEIVKSRIRTTSGDPPRYYYEIWTDLGDDCRLRIKTSPEFSTREAAQLACERATRRYKETMDQ
jgi:DNA-directed RNA polymerase subunit L